jgi:hypothetical protein
MEPINHRGKMRKTISCLLAVLCGTCAFVNASSDFITRNVDMNGEFSSAYSESYSYVCAGLGPVIPVPHIGLGYRQRFANQLGWDSSLVFATGGTCHQLGLNLMLHYYLHSEQQNSVYVGAGVRANGFLTNHESKTSGAVSLDTVIGKVLMADGGAPHFIELHFCSPSVCTKAQVSDLADNVKTKFTAVPMMYITYGVGF